MASDDNGEGLPRLVSASSSSPTSNSANSSEEEREDRARRSPRRKSVDDGGFSDLARRQNFFTPAPVIRRRSSSMSEADVSTLSTTPIATPPAPSQLVLLNRTSSFSRIVYELNNDLTPAANINLVSRGPIRSSSSSPSRTSSTKEARDGTTARRLVNDGTSSNIPNDARILKSTELVVATKTTTTKSDAGVLASETTSVSRDATPGFRTGEPNAGEKKVTATRPKIPFSAKLGILLSRSSGRDKFAQFLQYASLFWGNQPWVAVSQELDAPWRNLEESMSSGRKVLRLFKWIKEFERMQRSFWYEDVGPHRTATRALLARCLGCFMHTSSFFYYLIDNFLWASQVGLINRPDVSKAGSLRNLLKTQLPYEEYMKVQAKHRAEQQMLKVAKAREQGLKDWKNYSSLSRLLFCVAYCLLEMKSISEEVSYMDSLLAQTEATQREHEAHKRKRPAEEAGELAVKYRRRADDLRSMYGENLRELIASLCNLVILLNRMKMSVFTRVPTYVVGLLGVLAACIGLDKNWPRDA